MTRRAKLALALVVAALLAVAFGPFLVSVPPLEGTVPAAELAGPDSRFVRAGGLEVHYQERGEGPPVFVLLHGFGASLLGWRELMEPLGELGRVVAFDRPGFGLTERPEIGPGSQDPDNPFSNPYSPEAQRELVVLLMDALGARRAVLVSNSAGGTVALQVALEHPERVEGLVLLSAAVYRGGGAPSWARPLLRTPQADHLGPLLARRLGGEAGDTFLRRAYADPARLSDEALERYRLPLRAEGWDRALWELTRASRAPALAGRLGELRLPVLVLSGRQDAIVPLSESERLAREIPGATFIALEDCGHLPHEECPGALMAALEAWLD